MKTSGGSALFWLHLALVVVAEASLSATINSSGTKERVLDLLTLVASEVEDLRQSQVALGESQKSLDAQLDDLDDRIKTSSRKLRKQRQQLQERREDDNDTKQQQQLQSRHSHRQSSQAPHHQPHQDEKDGEEQQTDPMLQRLQILEQKLLGIADSSNSENIYLEGCNLHIRDGSGSTHNISGLQSSNKGNLIVGYNQGALKLEQDNYDSSMTDDAVSAPEVCSLPTYGTDAELCETHGGIWASSQTIGHHNVIVGVGHSYTHSGALVVGAEHASVATSTAMVGGHGHFAAGNFSSIAGGSDHVSLAESGTIVGGYNHVGKSEDATIAGGAHHTVMEGSEAATLVGSQNHFATIEDPFALGGTESPPILFRESERNGEENVSRYI